VTKSPFLFLLLIINIFIFSCGNKQEKLLARKWQLKAYDFPNKNEAMANADSALIKKLKEVADNTYHQFNSNGTFEVNMSFANEHGIWKLSEDGKSIITNKIYDKDTLPAETSQIDSLSENYLSVSQKGMNGELVRMIFSTSK
jgi:hypothetical protein